MAICPTTHRPESRFRVSGESRCALHSAFSRQFLRTSFPLAAVVGTILTAINQGTAFVANELPGNLAWKIPLTYSVPFVVSTWSQLRALRLDRS